MVNKNKIKFSLNKYYYLIISVFFMTVFYTKTIAIKYVPLVKENVFGEGTGATNDLGSFLKEAYNFGIALALILAALMIFVGGVQYMTTDNWGKKSDGLARIQDAAIGLGLALISYLVLYIINPELVTFSGNKILQ
jgi:hypothetical protein